MQNLVLPDPVILTWVICLFFLGFSLLNPSSVNQVMIVSSILEESMFQSSLCSIKTYPHLEGIENNQYVLF